MRYANTLLSVFAVLVTTAKSQDVLTTYWTQPPQPGSFVAYTEDEVLSLGSRFQLKWVTFLDSYSIWLWQQNLKAGAALAGSPVFTKTSGQSEPGTSTWLVDAQDFDLNQSNVFFFALGPNITLQGSMTSHYFNLSAVQATTQSQASTTTSSTTSTSGSLTTSTSASNLTASRNSTLTATPTSIASSSSSVSPSQSLNSTTPTSQPSRDGSQFTAQSVAGAAVALATIFLLIGASIVWWLRRKSHKSGPLAPRQEQPFTTESPAWAAEERLRYFKGEKQELSTASEIPRPFAPIDYPHRTTRYELGNQ